MCVIKVHHHLKVWQSGLQENNLDRFTSCWQFHGVNGDRTAQKSQEKPLWATWPWWTSTDRQQFTSRRNTEHPASRREVPLVDGTVLPLFIFQVIPVEQNSMPHKADSYTSVHIVNKKTWILCNIKLIYNYTRRTCSCVTRVDWAHMESKWKASRTITEINCLEKGDKFWKEIFFILTWE